jgi:hypothetical protein
LQKVIIFIFHDIYVVVMIQLYNIIHDIIKCISIVCVFFNFVLVPIPFFFFHYFHFLQDYIIHPLCIFKNSWVFLATTIHQSLFIRTTLDSTSCKLSFAYCQVKRHGKVNFQNLWPLKKKNPNIIFMNKFSIYLLHQFASHFFSIWILIQFLNWNWLNCNSIKF